MASKAAVHALAETLGLDLEPFGVKFYIFSFQDSVSLLTGHNLHNPTRSKRFLLNPVLYSPTSPPMASIPFLVLYNPTSPRQLP